MEGGREGGRGGRRKGSEQRENYYLPSFLVGCCSHSSLVLGIDEYSARALFISTVTLK